MGQSDHRQDGFRDDRSYSPYDNVRPQAYPLLLITRGINDQGVTYWEPAKWAAKVRATKTDDNLLLLKINMGAAVAANPAAGIRCTRKPRLMPSC